MQPHRTKIGPAVSGLLAGLLLAGCATEASPPALRREDVQWLQRVSFGIDSAGTADYRRVGRAAFLEQQLRPAQPLPAAAAAQVAALEAARPDPLSVLADLNAQYKGINAMQDGTDKELARKTLNERGNRLAYEAARRELLRALYSPAQLQEQLAWFWLNHFSVHQAKANVRWLVGDYAEHAIRPYVLGHFKALVLSTLEHPAMLQYLDNAQNAAGHINENYARELLELHTLGVNGGYSQRDVQELARVLTGVGVNAGEAPRLKPELQRLYLRRGAFEFNPARHDFGSKIFLGTAIEGKGFAEVEQAVALIVAKPACARFISRQLALYFVADDPPDALIERMARAFVHSDGDIAAVMRILLTSRELNASLDRKFKDPMRFVVSAVRFAYDGKVISNTRPLLNWLNALGEAPYGHATPDGYALTGSAWDSAGQMSKRFEIARTIGSGPGGLFDPEDGTPASTAGFPQLSNRLYFEAVEPSLSAATQNGLRRAISPQEWNSLLLASPDFNYE